MILCFCRGSIGIADGTFQQRHLYNTIFAKQQKIEMKRTKNRKNNELYWK